MVKKISSWKSHQLDFWIKVSFLLVVICIYVALLRSLRSMHSTILAHTPGNMSEDRTLEWWKTDIIYQIYPRSFADSNGDGIGDLKGMTSKLDYLKYINVGAVWLNPVFVSPMVDFGYDISNYRDIDPVFGTVQDFDEFIKEAHKRDIKVIMDLVVNHCSSKHEWFQKSCLREAPYDDYFIWRDGKRDEQGKPLPPNNWLSVFGGSAWHWHGGRRQFYYMAFLPEMPDLNYRNPAVVREMEDIVRFWMNHGVDGLRIDALEQLFEAEHLKDEPPSNLPGIPPFQHEYNKHIYTREQPEIRDVMLDWRKIVDEFTAKDGRPRFMVAETYGAPDIRNRFYEYGGCPFNHDLVDELTAPLSATKIQVLVQREYENLPEIGWPSFIVGNHDRQRISAKFGEKYVDTINMLQLTLRGTPVTYYGDELGLQQIKVTFEQTQDPWGRNFGPERYEEFSRDPSRSPMQWDSTKHAGFTKGSSPWLPVHPNYTMHNVKVQQESPQQTTLQMYAALARLRQTPTFQKGGILFSICDDNIISYVRQITGQATSPNLPRYLVVLNFGQESSTNDYSGSPVNSTRGVVVQSTCSVNDKLKDKEVELKDLKLDPGDGVVVQLL